MNGIGEMQYLMSTTGKVYLQIDTLKRHLRVAIESGKANEVVKESITLERFVLLLDGFDAEIKKMEENYKKLGEHGIKHEN